MDAGLLAQYLIVALAVLASVGVVMHKQFPQVTRKLRMVSALPLLREDRPDWLKQLGHFIAPAPSAGSANCAGCDSCD